MADVSCFFDHKKNHVLLAEWLAQRYSVTSANSAASVDDSPDLIILDGPALDRLWEPIRDRKSERTAAAGSALINRRTWAWCPAVMARDRWLILILSKKSAAGAGRSALARRFLDLHTVNQELWRKIDEPPARVAVWSNNRFERAAVVDGVIYDWNVPQNTVSVRSLESVLRISDLQTYIGVVERAARTTPGVVQTIRTLNPTAALGTRLSGDAIMP
jgi:hypothetical protein